MIDIFNVCKMFREVNRIMRHVQEGCITCPGAANRHIQTVLSSVRFRREKPIQSHGKRGTTTLMNVYLHIPVEDDNKIQKVFVPCAKQECPFPRVPKKKEPKELENK